MNILRDRIKEKLINVLIHILIFILIIVYRNQFFVESMAYNSIAISIIILGFIILYAASKTISKALAPNPPKLITTGIYSIIRHPLYLSKIVIYIGLALYFKSVLGIILILVFLIPLTIITIRNEEQKLIKYFGDKYTKYKKKTLF